MKTSKLLAICILLFCIGASNMVMAQAKGGRKKEHRNQRGSTFRSKKSSGHADNFARGGRKRGFFARVFRPNKSGSSWSYRKTRPGTKQNKEQSKLFTRNRTSSKRYRDGVIARQNKKRSSTRVRGNSSFSKRK